jgi:hypothetical protein
MSDEDSRPAKMQKLCPTNDQPVMNDFTHPLEWSSHVNGIARDEAAFFAGWCAARKKFTDALRQQFADTQVKECENVFSTLTFVFLRRKSNPATCSPDALNAPLLDSQPWFCRVLHSLTLPAASGALQLSAEVEGELRQVLQKALLELTKVSDIWTFKRSRADREAVLSTLERLRVMRVCNIDGSDVRELQQCAAGTEEQVAEQVQKRCHHYASTQGLVPYINRAFDEFCGVWVDQEVGAAVVEVLRRCSQDTAAAACLRVVCDNDMFTLSLEYPLAQTQAADVVVASAEPSEDGVALLCPSFPVHRTRLDLLRTTYALKFDPSSFYERVMACLLRYKAVFHPNGGTWQAAQPHGIFRLWAQRYFFISLCLSILNMWLTFCVQAGSIH